MKLISMLALLLLKAAASAQTERLILANLTIIDGRGGEILPHRDIVIQNGRILDIRRAKSRQRAPAETVIDLAGKYVIPGLIDSHYHFMPGRWPGAEGVARRRFTFFSGVTTARDMAGDAIDLAQLAKDGERPDSEMPRVYFSALMAGPKWFGDRRAADISHGHQSGTAPWARSIDENTDIAKAVSDAKASGAVAIKLYEWLSASLVEELTRQAHRQGLKVWSHTAIFPARPVDAVAAGVDSVSHSDGLIYAAYGPVEADWHGYRKLDWKSVAPNSPAILDLLSQMKKKGIFLDATLHLYDDMTFFEMEKKEQERNQWEFDRAAWAYAVTKLAHARGVPIVAGTDLPERPRRRDFANIHLEMESLVTKAGMTSAEAITAATLNGARLLGIERSFGSVEKGKMADLVVLDADPLADIRNTRRVVYVIKAGRMHKAEKVKMPE